MTEQLLNISKSGALCTIGLNRPKVLNALSFELLVQLKAALVEAFADADIKSIWLESTSQRAFCSGGDVKALIVELESLTLDLEKSNVGKKYFELEYGVDLLIEQSPKPIIAFSEGLTYGGGWGLFAGANLKLCTDKASFAMPEIQIGFYPDVGAAQFLQHADWKVGTFLAISGIPILAKEAMALDYVDDIISQDYAQILKQQLSRGIESTELDIASADTDVDDVHEHWQKAMSLLPETGALNDWISIAEEHVSFEPFKRAEKAWETGSSWSMAFAWNYFRACREMSRAKVLERDVSVGAFACAHPEFSEGVQAKLIKKEGQPNWLYPHVESVPLAEIMKAMG